MTYLAIDHVQLAMPAGQEAAARAFYAGVLGLTEVPKPPALAVRGDADLPGHRRFHVADPFGNRLEFLEAAAGPREATPVSIFP